MNPEEQILPTEENIKIIQEALRQKQIAEQG
jgi:hypothetical protein